MEKKLYTVGAFIFIPMKKILFLIAATLLLASCGSTQTPTAGLSNTGVQDVALSGSQSENPSENASESTDNPLANTVDAANPSEVTIPTYGSGVHVLEVFSDYQCPACQYANQTIMPVFKQFADAGKLTIEYRQFPLTTIHRNAFGDAMAAMCAQDQGKFAQYHEALYALEIKKKGALIADSERIALAELLGMNKDTFDACLSGKKYQKFVESEMKLGTSLGVTGTPTFFLDEERLKTEGFQTQADIIDYLENYFAENAQ